MPEERLAAIEQKIDAIYASIELMRKYMMWTGIVTLALIVLPTIGLMFAIPSFISSYNETLNSLDLEGL